MGAFEHVTVLLSFVYALAITHLLSRVGELIVQRARLRFSALLALVMILGITLVYSNWISLWDLRSASHWDQLTILSQFSFAIFNYLFCAISAPEARETGPIDMEAHYWRQRRYMFSLLLAVEILSLIGNVAFLKTANPAYFLQENAAILPMIGATSLALAWPARRVQMACLIALIGTVLAFLAVFDPVLG